MKRIFLHTLFLFIIASCATKNKQPNGLNETLQTNPFEFQSTENLTIEQAVNYQNKIKSKSLTNSISVFIDESIYPNNNQYNLTSPKRFEKNDREDYRFITEYYYSIDDNMVKVILYEWSMAYKEDLFLDDSKGTAKKNIQYFKNKFNTLKEDLTEYIGEPDFSEINSTNINITPFKDYYKWEYNNKSKAYLFMQGNHVNGFWRVRLAVYKD